MHVRRLLIPLLAVALTLPIGADSARAEQEIEARLAWASDPAFPYASRELKLTAKTPEGVTDPRQGEAVPLPLIWSREELPGDLAWLFAFTARGDGRLWFDRDFDGDLRDEEPMRFVVPSIGAKRIGLSFAHPLDTSALPEALQADLDLDWSHEGMRARVSLRAHREGDVVVGGRLRRLRLFDHDVNLHFNDPNQDRLLLDVNGDLRLSPWEGALDRVVLNQPLAIGGRAYVVGMPDPTGRAVRVKPFDRAVVERTPAWRPASMPPSGEQADLVQGAFDNAKDAYEAWMAKPHPHRLLPALERLIRAIGEAGTKEAFTFLMKMLAHWEEEGRARENVSVRAAIVRSMGSGHFAKQGTRIAKIAKTSEERPITLAAIAALHGAGAPKREKVYLALLKKAEDSRVVASLEEHLGYLATPGAIKLLEKRMKKETHPARLAHLYRCARHFGSTPPSPDQILKTVDAKQPALRAEGLRDALRRELAEAYPKALALAARPVADEALRAAVIEVLARTHRFEAIAAVLPLANGATVATRVRLIALLSALRDADAVRVLGQTLDAKPEDVRAVAAESLAGIGVGATESAIVARLKTERSPAVLAALIRAAGVLRSEASAALILAAVTRAVGEEDVLDAAVLALSSISTETDDVRAFFQEQLKERAWDARIAALSALASRGHPLAAALLIERLQDEDRRVRATAAQGLGRVRVKSAVLPLMAVLKEEKDARVRHAVAQALFFTTGQFLYDDLPTWERWWKENGAAFAVPLKRPTLPDTKDVETYGSTFYGVPVLSEKIVFVLDQSGSMGNMRLRPDVEETEERGWTELERAVHETLGVVDKLGEQARVNVVCFETGIHPWRVQPVDLSKGARKELRRWLEGLEPEGSTNLYDGLAQAIQMRDVEEIYLLSDGRPGAGRYRRTADILREVAKLNRKRRIAIHCVSLGVESLLLKRIAEENNGTYVRR